MKALLVFLGVCIASLAAAQNEELEGLGTFNILNLRYKINESWTASGEAQLRSLKFYDEFHYYEVKGMMLYHINKQFDVGGGGGKYVTYTSGGNFLEPKQSDEWRTWEQINMKLKYERLSVEHRYRIEQRFKSDGYRNRFRYRLGFTAPINKPKMETGSIYLNQSTELFFTDNEPYFERIRVYIGAGYVFSNVFTLQIGFLHQFDYYLVDETGRNMLQVALQFDLKRQNAEGMPKEPVED